MSAHPHPPGWNGRRPLHSHVPGHEGPCACVWHHRPGGFFHRNDGGLCGEFRKVVPVALPFGFLWWRRVGRRFHGIERDRDQGNVWSTATPWPWPDDES